MLKDTPFRTAQRKREAPLTWPAGLTAPKHRVDELSSVSPRGGWRVRAALLAISCLVVGALGGSIAGASLTSRSAHSKGACAAIRMAAAHGYLDDRQRRVVMRALTTAVNPDVESFPRYRAMRKACEDESGRR